MDELINEQISTLTNEMDLITNPYERALVRAQFLIALGSLSQVGDINTTTLTGKDAIKNDNIKPITFEEEKEEVEEIQLEEKAANNKSKSSKKTTKKTVVEETNEPNEILLEDESVIVQVEAEDGSMMDLDITEAYALTADYQGEKGDSEEDIIAARKELATQITSYALTPVYATLENIVSSNDKLMLAYYMQEYGVEEINGFVQELTDGNYSDVYEFATNDTIGALVADLEKAAEDAEE